MMQMRFSHLLFVVVAVVGISIGLPMAVDSVVSLTLEVGTSTNLRLSSFSADSYSIYTNGEIKFEIDFVDSGNTVVTAFPAIYIYYANNSSADNITFSNITLAGGESASLFSTWSSTNFPVGAYTAYANATYNGTNTETKNFSFTISIQPPPPEDSPPPPGSSGTPQKEKEKPKPSKTPPALIVPIPSPSQSTKIISQPILTDSHKGTSSLVYVVLNNPTNEPLKVSISSLSDSIQSGLEYYLSPNGKTTLPIPVSVSSNAESGYQQIVLNMDIGNGMEKLDVPVMLNVLSSKKDSKKVDVTREIKYDSQTKKVTVSLHVTNYGDSTADYVQINEKIAQDISSLLAQIEFTQQPNHVSGSSIVWDISDLSPGQTRTLSYTMPLSANVLESISRNSVSQVMVVDSPGSEKILISDIETSYDSISNLGHIRVSLFNSGEDIKSIYAQMIAPGGWSAYPKDKTITLEPRNERILVFTVQKTQMVEPGTYSFNLLMQYDEKNINRQIFLNVGREAGAIVWEIRDSGQEEDIFAPILSAVSENAVPVAYALGAIVVVSALGSLALRRMRSPSYSEERVSYIKKLRNIMEGPPE